jgi:hypothetical protein
MNIPDITVKNSRKLLNNLSLSAKVKALILKMLIKPLAEPHKHDTSECYLIIGDITFEVTPGDEKH